MPPGPAVEPDPNRNNQKSMIRNKPNHKGENKMENTRKSTFNLEAIAWGALFILWGITELFPALPKGLGRDRHRADPGRAECGTVLDRPIHQRLYDHNRHPGPAVGRTGTGTPVPAAVLRTADLCDPAAGAGFDHARPGTEEVKMLDHAQGWFPPGAWSGNHPFPGREQRTE